MPIAYKNVELISAALLYVSAIATGILAKSEFAYLNPESLYGIRVKERHETTKEKTWAHDQERTKPVIELGNAIERQIGALPMRLLLQQNRKKFRQIQNFIIFET